MSFTLNFYNSSEEIPILTTELIGYFSKDSNFRYHADLSQLKYYIPPPNFKNVYFDLNKNFTSTHHKSRTYCKLNDTLRWISDNFYRLEKPLSVHEDILLDVDFICRRGLLKKLFCSPYKINDGWIICASKYRGTIYLCEYYTNEIETRYTNATAEDKRISSLGFKFEQYVVADHPSHKPNPLIPLDENEEFHCIFKAKFGGHSLLYEAEIDGICSKEPITDTLIGKTIELIEIKTWPLNNKNMQCQKVKPDKIMLCWSQGYLANISKFICGLKDKSGIVRKIEEYPMNGILSLSQVCCDVRKSKMFCKLFLDNVKRIVTKDHDKCMYKFRWEALNKNIINYSEEAPDNETYFFLQSWFINKAKEYRNRTQ